MTSDRPTLLDFTTVIHSAGCVFDGLRASQAATWSFFRTGSTEDISSKADLHLLRDLKALAEHVIAHAGDPVDAAYLITSNEQITESGPLQPGRLRTTEQCIGAGTRYGRHEPPAITNGGLQRLLDRSIGGADVIEDALAVFVNVARAQPFGDGNKRTALFAANALLLNNGAGRLLSIPYDENDPAVADLFNDLLARAYVFGEDEGVKGLLRDGLTAGRAVAPYAAPFIVADSLEELQGPAVGLVVLPNRLLWNPSRSFDLSDDSRARSMLRIVLRDARTKEDLNRYVNRQSLIKFWGDLGLPNYIREAWEVRFPELKGGSRW